MQRPEVQADVDLARLARRRFQATVDWIAEFDWHFWATLTCERPVSERRIRSSIEKFEHGIRRRGQGRNPNFIFSIEGMPTNPHVHMLLRCRGRQRIGAEEIKQSWKLGMAHVRRYDSAGRASAYMFKAMRNDARFDSWGISSEFPCSSMHARD